MYLFRRHQSNHLAQMRIYGMLIEMKALLFAVQILADRPRLYSPKHASFFIRFTSRSGGARRITFYASFRKRPASRSRAHQQKFNAIFSSPVANCGHV